MRKRFSRDPRGWRAAMQQYFTPLPPPPPSPLARHSPPILVCKFRLQHWTRDSIAWPHQLDRERVTGDNCSSCTASLEPLTSRFSRSSQARLEFKNFDLDRMMIVRKSSVDWWWITSVMKKCIKCREQVVKFRLHLIFHDLLCLAIRI